MSPDMMRLIFGGFAVVLTGVAVNTLLLQPQVAPQLAPPALALPTPPPRATPQVAQPVAPPAAKTVAVAAPQKLAAKPSPEPAAAEPPAEPVPVRTARLATDSVQPSRMPRLPEIEGDPDVILRVQKELMSRGYGPVVPNGVIGPLSRAAVMAYEHDNGMPITGEATEVLLKRMRDGASTLRPAGPDARKIRSVEAEQVVRTVQHSLTTLGYDIGRIDGRMGEETERAIRAFEAANGISETGRVSAELFSKLARAMGARSAKVVP